MALLPVSAALLSLTLTALLLPASLVLSSTQFAPPDNYLVNCGSDAPTTLDPDNRPFVGDHRAPSSSFRLTSSRTFPLADATPRPHSSPIYSQVRVFYSASSYRFPVKQKGTHIVRLHIQRRSDPLDRQLFRVYAGEFLLIGDGVEPGVDVAIKEYFVWVDGEDLEIRFVPKKGSFAYVNAIEVISAPASLIADDARLLGGSARSPIWITGVTQRALETVYRVNVGGPKVTPFNDSLWRTWLPDDEYLTASEDPSIRRVYTSGPIRYQSFGPARQDGPDNVYNTARVVTSEKSSSIPNLNLTWTFPVVEGYEYLVRLHFCDIASVALGMLYFNVYVNGYLAYENLDLSSLTIQSLASPVYADFVVRGCGLDSVSVSVGPSDLSRPHSVDAILNGVEIFKMSNAVKSLDGGVGMDLKRSGICNALPLVAVVCLLVLLSMVVKRRLATLKDSGVWARLSLGGSDSGLKYSSIPLADKL
uniref:Malectin-like domain-containing protein n=1 Tax=Kalanchoe fedtschenkoi TaxID=63787 RepID=A0A7N0ZX06_KALFE